MGQKTHIDNDADYSAALSRAARLMDAPAGSPELAELEALSLSIEEYEEKIHPIASPTFAAFEEHLAEMNSAKHSDFASDVLNYTTRVNADAVDAIVKFCGIALKGKDSQFVSITDPAEVKRVVDGFCAKKLGLDTKSAEAAVKAVGEQMKADRTKHRVTVYYLLAEITGTLGRLAGRESQQEGTRKHSRLMT